MHSRESNALGIGISIYTVLNFFLVDNKAGILRSTDFQSFSQGLAVGKQIFKAQFAERRQPNYFQLVVIGIDMYTGLN
jgi:hypothetical protein